MTARPAARPNVRAALAIGAVLCFAAVAGSAARAAATPVPAPPAANAVPAAASSAPAASPAAGRPTPVASEMTSFEAGDEKVIAYLAVPRGAGSHPGMVVIQEWWGLNQQIKRIADRLAALGYAAIVPDLYRGKVASYKEPDLAHELMRGLNEDRSVGIAKGAAALLRSRAGVPTLPVGIIGFCMGGRVALATALKGGDVQAVVMFYGSVETTKEAVAPLACPLLGLFGKDDQGIPEEDVRKFEAALKAAGKTATIHIYPGVGHAFFNDERPGFEKDVAQDAWANVKDFLAKNLQPPAPPGPAR